MKRLVSVLFRIALVLSGFLFIFNLPLILGIGVDSVEIHFEPFWEVVKSDLQFLWQIKDDMYLSFFKQLDITGSYRYTMALLLICLIGIILIAMISVILIMMAPEKVRNFLKNGVNLFEAVPDLQMKIYHSNQAYR